MKQLKSKAVPGGQEADSTADIAAQLKQQMEINVKLDGIPFVPHCLWHSEAMAINFYDRPGSPPGNGWVCRSCMRERQTRT
jgi:hypothetical protein